MKFLPAILIAILSTIAPMAQAATPAVAQITIRCRPPLQPRFFVRPDGTKGARCAFVWHAEPMGEGPIRRRP